MQEDIFNFFLENDINNHLYFNYIDSKFDRYYLKTKHAGNNELNNIYAEKCSKMINRDISYKISDIIYFMFNLDSDMNTNYNEYYNCVNNSKLFFNNKLKKENDLLHTCLKKCITFETKKEFNDNRFNRISCYNNCDDLYKDAIKDKIEGVKKEFIDSD